MERKRIVHQLDTPFSTVQWPLIEQDDQDTILELLCSLLSPLGDYRSTYVSPSGGKRSKAQLKQQHKGTPAAAPLKIAKPPPPELSRFIDIGLSTITRGLQEMSSAARASCHDSVIGGDDDKISPSTAKDPPPYAAIFIARSGQASAFHCHFPQMVAVASQSSSPDQPPIRLIGFSKPCEDRLSESLGIPRASSIAVRVGAPLSQALLDFVRAHVSPVEMQWLKEAIPGHRETKINAVETTVGSKKQRVTK